MSATTVTEASEYRISGNSKWKGAWKKAASVGALGLAGSAALYVLDPTRFAFSWLFGFFFFLTLALGALFFVLVQHLTGAGWSVTVRRTAEFLMAGLPVFAILLLPVLASMGRLYPWVGHSPHGASVSATAPRSPEAAVPHAGQVSHHPIPQALEPAPNLEAALASAEHDEHARLISGKRWFLSVPFFLARAAIYSVVWILLSRRFFSLSVEQDVAKRLDSSVRSARLAPMAAILFALTTTFAAFDWLMSLNPTWYSTIFGVQVFSGAVVAVLATLVLLTLALKRSGLLGNAVNTEHYHDLGKLLFGFNAFWAYVSFSQFFLIWYSSIPEELSYYHVRWDDAGGTWKIVSAGLVVLHFIVPFWMLMSRNVKRRTSALAFGAVLLLALQVVEMYWNVMPNLGPLRPSWADVTCFLAVGGTYMAWVLHLMERHSLVPIGDPRLSRSLKFENA